MSSYFAKRLLLFIPMLFAISLIAFFINHHAPGDPIDRICGPNDNSETSVANSEQRKIWSKKLGLDLPLFYLSLTNIASPDTLYKIEGKKEREVAERLLKKCGNWPAVATYLNSLNQFEATFLEIKNTALNIQNSDKANQLVSSIAINGAISNLKRSFQEKSIVFQFQIIDDNLGPYYRSEKLFAAFINLKHNYLQLNNAATLWKNYVPNFHFYRDNQYHRWLFGDGNMWNGEGSTFSKGILRGDFGTSYSSKAAVSATIWQRLKVSLLFSLFSILLAYNLSLPIAAYAALHPNSIFDRFSAGILFFMYALPSFFVASLLLLTFSNPSVFSWLPSSGIGPLNPLSDATFFENFMVQLPYLLLPFVCYTYAMLAFIGRSMRSVFIDNLPLDYIRTARAKGLSEANIILGHVLKNALVPLITIFSNVFPYAIGGAVIIESIFSLPGIGLEIVHAIKSQDYPVLVAVFTLAGFLTLTVNLLCDFLCALVDPRITFSRQ